MIFVLIPAFNEAGRLKELLPGIPDSVDDSAVRTIVISDGSTDGTPEIAAELGAEVIALPSNRGKGAALRKGAAALENRALDCVVLMDGDGQHDPSFLSSVVAPVLSGDYHVVVGSRYLDDPKRGATPRNRYLVRRLVTWYLRRRLSQPVTDPFSGYRCLSQFAFDTISLRGNEYEGELEMRFEAEIHGLELEEVPIPRVYMDNFSKMGSHGGPLVGRLRAIGQYVRTIVRKRRELASATRSAVAA
ncbi:MAG: glycosyltransferase family 2 protein [Acidimicrobiia bacterium]